MQKPPRLVRGSKCANVTEWQRSEARLLDGWTAGAGPIFYYYTTQNPGFLERQEQPASSQVYRKQVRLWAPRLGGNSTVYDALRALHGFQRRRKCRTKEGELLQVANPASWAAGGRKPTANLPRRGSWGHVLLSMPQSALSTRLLTRTCTCRTFCHPQAVSEAMASSKERSRQYLKEHPELTQMLQDFMTAVLAEKPPNAREYASKYFERFASEPAAADEPASEKAPAAEQPPTEKKKWKKIKSLTKRGQKAKLNWSWVKKQVSSTENKSKKSSPIIKPEWKPKVKGWHDLKMRILNDKIDVSQKVEKTKAEMQAALDGLNYWKLKRAAKRAKRIGDAIMTSDVYKEALKNVRTSTSNFRAFVSAANDGDLLKNVEAIFAFLDGKNCGLVDIREDFKGFGDRLQRLFPGCSQTSLRKMQATARRVDADNNGSLDKAEFRNFLWEIFDPSCQFEVDEAKARAAVQKLVSSIADVARAESAKDQAEDDAAGKDAAQEMGEKLARWAKEASAAATSWSYAKLRVGVRLANSDGLVTPSTKSAAQGTPGAAFQAAYSNATAMISRYTSNRDFCSKDGSLKQSIESVFDYLSRKDRSGLLTTNAMGLRKRLRKLLTESEGKKPSRDQVDAVLIKLQQSDADKSGAIDLEEFYSFAWDTLANQEDCFAVDEKDALQSFASRMAELCKRAV